MFCQTIKEAEVLEYAQVKDEARILGCAVISGFAVVAGKAIVNDWALVTGIKLMFLFYTIKFLTSSPGKYLAYFIKEGFVIPILISILIILSLLSL